jgi:hypothetical protein
MAKSKKKKKQQQQQRKTLTLPWRKVAATMKTAKQMPVKKGIQSPNDATSQSHIQTILKLQYLENGNRVSQRKPMC